MSNLDCRNAIITEENDSLIITYMNKAGEEEKVNLLDKIKEFTDIESVNLKLSKVRNSKSPNRKPTFKYNCPKCGKLVKSYEENLIVQCGECNEEYIPVVK